MGGYLLDVWMRSMVGTVRADGGQNVGRKPKKFELRVISFGRETGWLAEVWSNPGKEVVNAKLTRLTD